MTKHPLAFALLLPAIAQAGQARPAAAYRGTYDLQCASAMLSLDLGVAYTTVTGANGNWGDVYDIALACETPASDIADFAGDIEAGCLSATIPADVCSDAADQVYTALLPLTTLGQDVLPVQMHLNVTTASWFSQWTGMYSAYGWHRFSSGQVSGWGYVLDNNVGANEGHLGAFGIGVGPSTGVDGAGCTVAGVATVDGRVNPLTGYSFSATFGLNQSLICALANEGGGAVATLGVTLSGSMVGQKVP